MRSAALSLAFVIALVTSSTAGPFPASVDGYVGIDTTDARWVSRVYAPPDTTPYAEMYTTTSIALAHPTKHELENGITPGWMKAGTYDQYAVKNLRFKGYRAQLVRVELECLLGDGVFTETTCLVERTLAVRFANGRVLLVSRDREDSEKTLLAVANRLDLAAFERAARALR